MATNSELNVQFSTIDFENTIKHYRKLLQNYMLFTKHGVVFDRID